MLTKQTKNYMQLNVNEVPSDAQAIEPHIQHNPTLEAVPAPGIDLPGPPMARQPRNQHLKVAEPKDRQFTGRCTQAEHKLISDAMQANGCMDIVRLMLYSIKLHKNDVFSSFKLG